MSAAFDTLEISKRLKSVGFDDAQAEAITGVLRDSREADLSKLATKEDVARVETTLSAEMEILRRDLTIRLGGMIVVATGVLLASKFFG
jgi:triphosphoribosyl-dephospho-CoA synthetase